MDTLTPRTQEAQNPRKLWFFEFLKVWIFQSKQFTRLLFTSDPHIIEYSIRYKSKRCCVENRPGRFTWATVLWNDYAILITFNATKEPLTWYEERGWGRLQNPRVCSDVAPWDFHLLGPIWRLQVWLSIRKEIRRSRRYLGVYEEKLAAISSQRIQQGRYFPSCGIKGNASIL